jgi:hypothetical protein
MVLCGFGLGGSHGLTHLVVPLQLAADCRADLGGHDAGSENPGGDGGTDPLYSTI